MGFLIAQMRSELRIHLGNLTDAALPDADCDLLINRSWWQVQNSIGFEELEAKRTFDTVLGTNSYAIVPSVDQESIKTLSYEDASGRFVPIYPWNIEEYVAEYSSDTNFRGAPEKYYRQGDNIIIWPDPDDVYTITLNYLGTLADWNDANPSITVPQAAHEIILYGAIWRGYDRIGNLNRGNAFLQRQEEMVKLFVTPAAKDENAMQYARVIPLRSKYP